VSGGDKFAVRGDDRPRAAESWVLGEALVPLQSPRLMQPILGRAGKCACDPLGFVSLHILAWCLSPALSLAGFVPLLSDLGWGKVEPETCDSDLLRKVVVLVFILRRCCGEFLLSVLFNTAFC